jgi:hypothetical protein
MKSIVSYGITNASDMTQDTLQMPDDLTDEDEGKTKDDEKILTLGFTFVAVRLNKTLKVSYGLFSVSCL